MNIMTVGTLRDQLEAYHDDAEVHLALSPDTDYEIASIYSENDTKEDRVVWIDIDEVPETDQRHGMTAAKHDWTRAAFNGVADQNQKLTGLLAAERDKAGWLRTALELISEIQRDKCKTADAATLLRLLDFKVALAVAALETVRHPPRLGRNGPLRSHGRGSGRRRPGRLR